MNVALRTIGESLILALACLLCSCSDGSKITMPTTTTTPSGVVTISNNQLMRDGKPWVPHGYYMIAFEAAPTKVDATEPWWNNAYTHYTPQEFEDMRAAGADSVRMQVSQPGMDPKNTEGLYSPTYSDAAVAAVKAARAAGLVVILSVQDEKQSGETGPGNLPNPTTRAVWAVLALALGTDKGVLFELYNEPQLAANDTNYATWATQMNKTIDTARTNGSQNVMVVDALGGGQTLTGAPALTDPMNEVLYAAHPYVFPGPDAESQYSPAVWDANFGNFAATHPVLISEWGEGYFHTAATTEATLQFFGYLQSKNIGLEAGIWDWIDDKFATVRVNFPTATAFSTYLNPDGSVITKTATAGWGPGKTIVSWYTTGVIPPKPL